MYNACGEKIVMSKPSQTCPSKLQRSRKLRRTSNILIKLIGWHATILHEDPCAFDRYRWLKKHLKKGALKTLDAGCGLGAFALYAAKQKNSVVGLSFESQSNQKAQKNANFLNLKNVNFKEVDLRQLDKFKNQLGQYDQIICFETIEHIINDEKLLKDLADLLKPGGKLLITTPFKYYKRLWKDTISATEDGGHVRWGYTHDEIAKLFDQANLRVEIQEYVSGFISQQLTNLSRLLGIINKRLAWTIILPLRIFQLLDPLLTRIIKYPCLSIAVIGTKKNKKLLNLLT